MKHRMLSLVVFASLFSTLYSAEPTRIVGPTKVDAYKLVQLSPDSEQPNVAYVWDIDHEDIADALEQGSKLIFTGPPGTYKVKLRILSLAAGKATVQTFRHTIVIGDNPNPLVPPVPPGPNPPVPPVPPTPSISPIAGDGLRVLLLYDRQKETSYPVGQQDIINGKTVRDYLRTKTAKEGSQSQFFIWPTGADVSAAPKIWQDAYNRPKTATPWVIISNPQKGGGYEGPMPNTVPEMMDLLKKYGGE